MFALQVLDFEFFLFGRVISTDAEIGPMKNVILLYVYDYRSESKDEIPPLDKNRLLIPPSMTNTLPWSRGYFQTVRHDALDKADILPVHCFQSRGFLDRTKFRYFDGFGNRLKKRTEPCGEHGLGSFRTIDDDISKALGIPPAPDD